MGQHYLRSLFAPNSLVFFGYQEDEKSVGHIVLKNIIDAGYKGEIFIIYNKAEEVFGIKTYPDAAELTKSPELAIVCSTLKETPAILESCGLKAVRSAVLISSGYNPLNVRHALQQAITEQAHRFKIRLLGPHSIGIMRPNLALNATFSHVKAKTGNLALVSQSGALCNAILDWAEHNDVGFSSVIALGAGSDVQFGEILDYLVADFYTESILLYIEGIHNSRDFLSSLRAAARIKPVIVLKSGRHLPSFQSTMTHAGTLVGMDDVFDAALRRAGAVRVQSFMQLFSAAKTLSSGYRPCGNRLAIITNGTGPGMMAADRATDLGVRVAELSEATIEKLNQALPQLWSRRNPIDIVMDATPVRYQKTVIAAMEDQNVDGVLVIVTPQATLAPTEVAEIMLTLSSQYRKPLLVCFMGERQVAESRAMLAHARVPNFRTPEPAVEAFSYISAYYQNQQLLMQTPGPLSDYTMPDVEGARLLIESVLSERRRVLTEMESKALLAAFRIPIAKTMVAYSPNEAIMIAEQLGFPVAMKINSPDIQHKSDVGGVRLNIKSALNVRLAFNEMIQEVQRNRPDAKVNGVSIQPMSNKPNGRELMVGVSTDPIFGPVIVFGAGGTTIEVLGDRAVTLPPLNHYLARNLIERTRVVRLLRNFRHLPEANLNALENVLLRVSEMICELPWLREMDINPLIVDEDGALALDARIVIDYQKLSSPDRYSHMAICPYPTHLVRRMHLQNGAPMEIRPIRPEDAEMEQEFIRDLSEESKYFRFMDTMNELTPKMLVRFTQIDYDREMALVAVTQNDMHQDTIIGVSRYAINPDGRSCEFALVVSDHYQGQGLGAKLMLSIMDAARVKGLRTIEGEVLSNNHGMLKLMTHLGFSITTSLEDSAIKIVVKDL